MEKTSATETPSPVTDAKTAPRDRAARESERRIAAIPAETYAEFAKLFGWIIALTAALVGGMAVVMSVIPLSGPDTFDKTVMLRMMQIAFGNFFGGVCIYLGVVLSWFGIRESVRVAAEGPTTGRFDLQTASPGVILMLGGMILIGVAMFSRIEIAERPTKKRPAVKSAMKDLKQVDVSAPPQSKGVSDADESTGQSAQVRQRAIAVGLAAGFGGLLLGAVIGYQLRSRRRDVQPVLPESPDSYKISSKE